MYATGERYSCQGSQKQYFSISRYAMKAIPKWRLMYCYNNPIPWTNELNKIFILLPSAQSRLRILFFKGFISAIVICTNSLACSIITSACNCSILKYTLLWQSKYIMSTCKDKKVHMHYYLFVAKRVKHSHTELRYKLIYNLVTLLEKHRYATLGTSTLEIYS